MTTSRKKKQPASIQEQAGEAKSTPASTLVTLSVLSTTEIDWKSEAKSINEKVHEFCVFGSINLNLSALRVFSNLLLAVNKLLNYRKTLNSHQIIGLTLSGDYAKIDKIRENALKGTCMSRYKMVNSQLNNLTDNQIYYLPLLQIASFLPMIKNLFPKLVSKWDAEISKIMHAVFGVYLHDLDTIKKLQQNYDETFELAHNEIRLNELSEVGFSRQTDADQDFFFEQTIYAFRTLCGIYGQGNCDPMADGALLEAVWRGHPCQLIKFTHSKNIFQEELNAIALGELKPGCLIVAPWRNEENRIVMWNGTPQKTPTLDMFDTVHIKFSASQKNIAKYRKMLEDAGYTAWLDNPTRKQNIKFITLAVKSFEKTLASLEACAAPAEKKAEAKVESKAVTAGATEQKADEAAPVAARTYTS